MQPNSSNQQECYNNRIIQGYSVYNNENGQNYVILIVGFLSYNIKRIE